MKSALVIIITTLLISSACQRGDMNRASAAPENALSDSLEKAMDRERDQYVDTMNARLEEMELKIDDLEERAKGMKAAVRDRLRTDIMLLRDEKQMVADKFAYVEEVSAESWTKLKTYVDSEYVQLEGSYENISTRRDLK